MFPGRVLLALPFAGLLLGGLRHPWAWTAAAALIWGLAAVLAWRGSRFSGPLRPWLPWLAWAGLGGLLSSQPWKSLYPWSRWLGVLIFFGLIRALWGERERRRWFWGLMAAAPVLGLAALWTGWRELIDHGSGEVMFGLLPPYYNYTVFVLAAAVAAAFSAAGRGGLVAGKYSVNPRSFDELSTWIVMDQATDSTKYSRVHRMLTVAGRAMEGFSQPGASPGKARLALWAVVGFGLLILVLARARAGLLAVAGAALLSVLRQGRARRLIVPALVVLLGGAGLTGAVVLWRGGSLAHMLKLDKAKVFKRPQLWKAALEVAAENPVLGEGLGNFEAGFARHNFPSRYRLTNYQFTAAHAHSEVLQLAAETGWPGLVLFALGLAGSARGLLLRRRAQAWEREAALSALAAMAALCLIDNMLHLPALAMLFFSALACAQPGPAETGMAAGPAAAVARLALRGGASKALCLAGLALCLAAGVPEHLAGSYEGRAQAEKDPNARVALMERAARLFPADFRLREGLARAYLAASPPRPDRALEELTEASELNPTNALYLVIRAELLRGRGEAGRALSLAEKAIELEPNFLQARLLRAEAWARGGHKAAARSELSEALRRRSAMEDAFLYAGNRHSLYVGYDFQVGAFDEKRYEQVRRLAERESRRRP